MRYRYLLTSVLLLLLASLLTSCGDSGNSSVPTNIQNPPGTAAQMAIGRFREYNLPQDNSGLMRPVIDGQGRLWFGEMSRNYLGSFDARTGKFWQQTPPGGQSGIMGMAVAPDDSIWFAEQYADYIGHYSPASGQYSTYQLPTIHPPDPNDASKILSLPSAPNDIFLDKHGSLWFTELNANAIGRLNTANGSISHYPLAHATNASALNPYGITADPQSNIWFTEASASHLGRLNPLSGQISYFTPPGVTVPLMEVASDARGQIWATTFSSGLLIHFNPTSTTFTVYHAPAINGNPGGLYGLVISPNGDVWVTITAENLLARFDSKTQRFYYYSIPTAGSLPIGLVEGANSIIWFTEAGSNKIGVLQP